jgi:hypothetical protein
LLPSKPVRKGAGDPARPVHYVSDGSGRDSYVFANDGGFSNPNNPCDARIVFKQNLRKYEPIGDYLHRRNYEVGSPTKGQSVFKKQSLEILKTPRRK